MTAACWHAWWPVLSQQPLAFFEIKVGESSSCFASCLMMSLKDSRDARFCRYGTATQSEARRGLCALATLVISEAHAPPRTAG